jgi:hypothetical protein
MNTLVFISNGGAIRTLLRGNFFNKNSMGNSTIYVMIPSQYLSSYQTDATLKKFHFVPYKEADLRKTMRSSRFSRLIRRVNYYTENRLYPNPSARIHLDIYATAAEKTFRGYCVLLVVRSLVWLASRMVWVTLALRKLDLIVGNHNDFYRFIWTQGIKEVITSNFGNFGYGADSLILKAAINCGIKTRVIMVGWDNSSSKGVANIVPDTIYAWSSEMSRELTRHMRVPEARVKITGSPYFDQLFLFLKTKPTLVSSELHTVFLTLRSPNTYSGNVELCDSVVSILSEIGDPYLLFVRPHPNTYRPNREGVWEHQDLHNTLLARVSANPNIKFIPFRSENFMPSDISNQEFEELYSALAVSDVVINSFSSMIFESLILNIPIINIEFNADDGRNNEKPRQDVAIDKRFLHNNRIKSTGLLNSALNISDLRRLLRLSATRKLQKPNPMRVKQTLLDELNVNV